MSSRIPKAPAIPYIPKYEKHCKIVISSGKLNEGYCITTTELGEIDKGYYQLPGSNIVIDQMSYDVFKYPDIRAFVAVPRDIRIKGKTLYSLHPLKKNDFDRYVKKEMDGKEIEMKYEPPKVKGEGTYGKVEFFPTERLAVKHSKIREDTLSDDMVKEIAVYKLLRDIACQPKLFSFSIQGEIKLKFELGTGTLDEAWNLPTFTEKDEKLVMFRLAKCLRASASQGLIHGDLKPMNCIVTYGGDVQVIDWGLVEIDKSRGQKFPKHPSKQTLWWRAPELLTDPPLTTYSNKIDIFSLGLMFLETYKRHVGIISGDNDIAQARGYLRILLEADRATVVSKKQISSVLLSVVQDPISQAPKIKERLLNDERFKDEEKGRIPEELADLVSKMLEFNPDIRIGYDEIILHPFFQNIRRESIPKPPIFINNMPVVSTLQSMLSHQIDINVKMRKVLFSWMVEVFVKFKFFKNFETLCLSFQLIDLYIQKKQIKRSKLQALGCMCLHISSKLFEENTAELGDYVWISASAYTKDELATFFTDIITVLEGNLLIPTLYSYWSHYNGAIFPGKHGPGSMINSYLEMYLDEQVYNKSFSEKWQDILAQGKMMGSGKPAKNRIGFVPSLEREEKGAIDPMNLERGSMISAEGISVMELMSIPEERGLSPPMESRPKKKGKKVRLLA